MRKNCLAALGALVGILATAGEGANADCFRYSTGALFPSGVVNGELPTLQVAVLNNDPAKSLTATVTQYVTLSISPVQKQVLSGPTQIPVGPLALNAVNLTLPNGLFNFEIQIFVSGDGAKSGLVTVLGFASDGTALPEYRILHAELSGGQVPCVLAPQVIVSPPPGPQP